MRTLAAALNSRHLLIAHPTVAPETARQAAKIVQQQGARYLDAPFTGSKTSAANAQLVYYLAGTEAAQREARPVLEASSKKIVSIGEEVGHAAVVKLATNMMAALHVQGLAEALALVHAAGVDSTRFAEALEFNGARSGTSDNKLPLILAGKFEPHFALKHLLKDVRHALHLAASLRLSTPATGTTGALIAGAVARGWGELDFSALAKNYDLTGAQARTAAVATPAVNPRTNGHSAVAPAAKVTTLAPAAPPTQDPPAAAVKSADKDIGRTPLPEQAGEKRTPADDLVAADDSAAKAVPAARENGGGSVAAAATTTGQPGKTRSLLRSILGLGQKETPPAPRASGE